MSMPKIFDNANQNSKNPDQKVQELNEIMYVHERNEMGNNNFFFFKKHIVVVRERKERTVRKKWLI